MSKNNLLWLYISSNTGSLYCFVVYKTESHHDSGGGGGDGDGDVPPPPPDWCNHFDSDQPAFGGLPTVDNLDKLDKLLAECQQTVS